MFLFERLHLRCRAPPAVAIPGRAELHGGECGLACAEEKAGAQLMGDRFVLRELVPLRFIDGGSIETHRFAVRPGEPGDLGLHERRLMGEVLRAVRGPVDQLGVQPTQFIE